MSTCCLYQTCRELAPKHFQSGKTKIPNLGTKFRSGSPDSRPCAVPGLGRTERGRRAGRSTLAVPPAPPGHPSRHGPAARELQPPLGSRPRAATGRWRRRAAHGGRGRGSRNRAGWGVSVLGTKAGSRSVPPPERFHTRMVPSVPPSLSQCPPHGTVWSSWSD